MTDDKLYAIDEFQMRILKRMAERLCAGSDKVRDEGNALWLIIWEAERHAIPATSHPAPGDPSVD